jgi:hypothetical protein
MNLLTKEDMPLLAEYVATIIMTRMSRPDDDPYLQPKQLHEVVPSLSESGIRAQIRTGKYGKKIGAKGKLVAKKSEVKKYNRL